jgi:hypothetical protein
MTESFHVRNGNGVVRTIKKFICNYALNIIICILKIQKGQTGFPWIDACMRQLRQEGWIHHICRNSVAIFLTRGGLFKSWNSGLKVFLLYQIDVIC